MYGFLLSRRWLGYAVVGVLAAAAMVLLGNWQWDRYQDRRASNERVEAGGQATPAPVAAVLPRGDGAAPPGSEWARITATGRYDAANEILARGRTVNARVGFEVVTPLVLDDGSAVLVDRGWIEAIPGDALARPTIPPPPTGPVTVVGRVHLSETRPRAVDRRDGRLEVRRISATQLEDHLPYPVLNGYVLLTEQTPAAGGQLTPIPIRTQNAWQSGAYAVQWWLFAALVPVGFWWAARRETRDQGAAAGTDTVVATVA
ncbi:SURF1 family cytochrome oxidase biogenesis protein [Spirilliplanes yamanashiensis]|uniref:SURF1-like protein n=1 Tax=Spirilliplanes yamanashiensis TaxID=42233 RepID=A0A8J4DMW6_9ACTN|nr:SURF1 family protein [Spirilliplanes yamanashiensis]MDP9818394.1 cytochrome oxidase assembly protein ShyY1 [Spirilliplanes yamanashiensis]GIJ06615.1 SURF1-like protein [Spirilliplanes yamanashiensis]